MAKESYSEYQRLTEGVHIFKILSVGERVPTTNSHYRKWILESHENGERIETHVNMFPWIAVPLLEAIGYAKVKGKVDWETDEVNSGGKVFKAVITYEQDKYARLDMFQPVGSDEEIPF